MSDKNHEPAFPVNGPNGDHPGMELRDWFAGQALPGLIAGTSYPRSFWDRITRFFGIGCRYYTAHKDSIAEAAYEQADSMLKARED